MRVCVRKGLPSGEICADLSPLVPFSFYFQMRACYRAFVDALVLTDLEKANGRDGRIEGGGRDLCLISVVTPNTTVLYVPARAFCVRDTCVFACAHMHG